MALPIAHDALVDVLIDAGKHEAWLAFSAPPVGPHLRQRVKRPVAAFRSQDRSPERSRKFGERIVREAGPSEAERLRFAFRTVLSRAPSVRETQVLMDVLQHQRQIYRDGERSAKLLAVGEAPADARIDPVELSAWTIVASVLLNLDESVTKG